MPDVPPTRILETTLRDGSYVLKFQFSAADTEGISRELDRLGFELIEVGHGVGLNASNAGYGVAAESDASYMKAAARAVTRGRWGMFCIPGIARLEDVDLAADHGMGFIRIGTNVTDAASAEPFVARARQKGMFVAVNFMKSYAMAPGQFAHIARRAAEFGADVVYIVDSAGGMLTSDLEHYFAAIREQTKVPIGFHGHDNLGLSVANAYRAVELGAAIVDTSLQGLGRSAGNTPTELFLAVMARAGRDLGFDMLGVMDVGDRLVRPLVRRIGHDSLDIVTGYAQFHTSYMDIIREHSTTYGVDPRRLIIAVCEEDRINAGADLVKRHAEWLRQELGETTVDRSQFERYFGAEQTTPPKK